MKTPILSSILPIILTITICTFFMYPNVEGHPTTSFIFMFTNSTGDVLTNGIGADTSEDTTIYFIMRDVRNDFEILRVSNLVRYQGYYVEVGLVSQDMETVSVIHTDDFMDMDEAVSSASNILMVQTRFPKGGYWNIVVRFMYRDPFTSVIREGLAGSAVGVSGGPDPYNVFDDSYVYDLTNTVFVPSFAPDANSNYHDYVDMRTNIDPEGFKAIIHVDKSLRNPTTNEHPSTITEHDVVDIPAFRCGFYMISIFNADGSPATLVPIFESPVRLNIIAQDGGIYTSHATYLPTGMSISDFYSNVSSSASGISSLNQATDPLFNLTLNGLAIGVQGNHTMNCAVDSGYILQSLESIATFDSYHGPTTFGPSIIGSFDFPGAGPWRIFANMKVKLASGLEHWIVPQFSVSATYLGLVDNSTTGDDDPDTTVYTTTTEAQVSSARQISLPVEISLLIAVVLVSLLSCIRK